MSESVETPVVGDTKPVAPRKPPGYVLCGACGEFHPNVNFVKVCYLKKQQAAT